VLSEQVESHRGQGYLAVTTALAADMEDSAGTVDIGELEAGAFHEAQATCVDSGQADAIDGDADGVENAPDLLSAEDDGERLGVARLGDVQAFPIAAERLVVEEPETAEGNRKGASGQLLVDRQVQQIAANLFFFERVGRTAVVACQLGDGMNVALDRARGVAPQLHLLDHLTA
jgi:hypothetical protein